MKKRITLDRLLKWAVENELYIEICGDGSVTVENEKLWDGYSFLAEGPTLRSALIAAKAELEVKDE